MLNDRFLSEHFQKYMLTDNRLLAIEVPGPISSLSKGWQRLLLSGSDCHPDWRRENPIATVMSSDCYSLTESGKGYIGKRHSWIRMSENTIEALRQALKDHQSRILLQDPNPSEDIRYGRIESLQIENVAFLENQTINFSPNFNCIIGGRGAGKSSILEYIRLCANYKIERDNIENLDRIRNTLGPESKLQLTWRDISGSDTFKHDMSDGESKIISREEDIDDPETIFKKLGVQIYSQREISNIANDTQNLLRIIDQITGASIDALKQQESSIKEDIRSYQHEKNKLYRKISERRSLNQEINELQRRWDSFVAVKKENEKRLANQEAKKYLETILSDTEEIVLEWDEKVNSVIKGYELVNLEDKSWSNKDFFNELNVGVQQANGDLAREVKGALQKYKEKIAMLTIENDKWWGMVHNSFEESEAEFLKACEREGLKPEELEILKDVNVQKNKKEKQLEELEIEISELQKSVEKLEELFETLYQVWNQETKERIEKIHSLIERGAIPRIEANNEPFIKVEINHMGDETSFLRHWNNIKVKRNTRLGRNWEEIGGALFAKFLKEESFSTPWELLLQWVENKDKVPSELQEHYDQLVELLSNAQIWDELMIQRINDEIDITLFRDDGSRAGSLLDNGLSDGQKNTAILTLLFTEGTSPIIIDQPEDELDSDFIYNQLVPLIRNIKNNRQVIVTSHNANLPVNGDAELVYALRTEMGNGMVRNQGGIDNEDVRESILDIMEGSEEAFRKRQEKYYS